MEAVFTAVLRMSVTASWVILAVLLTRLVLRKAPKKYAYWLWSVVGFRLCCPVTWQMTLPASVFRLFSPDQWGRAPAAPAAPVAEVAPMTPSTATEVIVTQNPVLAPVAEVLPAPNPAASVDPIQVWLFIGSVVWLAGIAALLIYGVVSYLRLCRRMETATPMGDNIYQCEAVRSPFILGVLRPRIYIPYGLPEEQLDDVLAHERYHLRRRDHLIRMFAFLLLSVHWFNPLCWLSLYFVGKDMEMSCDEKVLSEKQGSVKNYSMSLLSFAANRRFPAPSPLAFGETAVKSRIKNVLRWRRPKLWVTVISALLCLLVVVSCSAQPVPEAEPPAELEETVEPEQTTGPTEPAETAETAEAPTEQDADPPTEETDPQAPDDSVYIGEYLDADVNEPNLEIAKGNDGKYIVQIGIYGLTALTDGVGELTEEGMTFTATDAAGNPISGIITVEGQTGTVTFTDSTWELIENGSAFAYDKSSDTPNLWSE